MEDKNCKPKKIMKPPKKSNYLTHNLKFTFYCGIKFLISFINKFTSTA